MTRSRSPYQVSMWLGLGLLAGLTITGAPARAAGAPRIAMFINAMPGVDPIPTVFDKRLYPSFTMGHLVDLDALAPQLSGGAELVETLRPKANVAATDFRFHRHGIDGRLRFLSDADPFLAYGLTLTNTTDEPVSLFFTFQLPTETMTPTVSVASQLFGAVSSDSAQAPAVLTYEQIILLALADGGTLATPFRLSGAGVEGLPIFVSIPDNPIPTALPVTAIALQSNLTLTPGDTAHLTGHLAASNFQFPMIAGGDIQLLLAGAVIPEPSTAGLLVVGLMMVLRRR